MNIVPEDDVGHVTRSGESEPGLGHDLDEPVSGEGAARSDLHAGRMKSLRHLFMMDVQQPAARGRTTPSPTHARQRSELALFIVVLAVRSTHLVDGGLTLVAGWASYRHPVLDGGLVLLALIESVVILSLFWRRRAVRGPVLASVDVAFGMLALVAMVALTPGPARSSWVNWACPFTYGSVVIALLAFRRRTAAAVAVAFAGVYLVTVTSSLTAGQPDLLATSLANAMTYIGLLVAGSFVFGALRRSAAEADDARAEAVTRGARLAAERERNAQHRLLHDSALQTLEIVAQSTSVDDAVRCQARSEAMTLRLALQGEPATGSGGLLEGLQQLAIQFARRGLHVEVHDTGLESRPEQAGVRALSDATREALANVAKHAGVDRAVVSARSTGTAVEVTVRDQGAGFDPLAPPPGFGLCQSIEGRLAEVDGTVSIWSAPGRGHPRYHGRAAMTTVAIVEDHPIFRQGLSHVIETAEPVEISGVYRSLEDFLAHAPARIDIVLLDLHLPGIGGAEGVRAVRERGHRVLVVSVSDSPDTVVAAIAAGAAGYLTKDADGSEIIRAVSVITAGGTYVSPTLASHLLAVERRAGPAPLQLSDREREILALVAAGERDQDIAEQLFISISTVRSHLDRIRDKTGRRRRPDLTRLAAETGLTDPRTGR